MTSTGTRPERRWLTGRDAATWVDRLVCGPDWPVTGIDGLDRVVGTAVAGGRGSVWLDGQELIEAHARLYAAAGQHLPFLVHLEATAPTRQGSSVHAAHEGLHAVADTGAFTFFGASPQEVLDFSLIGRRIAEAALVPGIVAQDALVTAGSREPTETPTDALVHRFLGSADEEIAAPTPAQRLVFGDMRRRVPSFVDLDAPAMIGALQRRDAYHQGVAATKAFVAPTVGEIADGVLADYAQLTGRRYRRLDAGETDGADFLILAQGSLVPAARRVAARVRETRGDRVGVVGVVMLRPLAVDQLVALLEGRTGVLVLERSVDPFSDGGPLLREVRAVLAQAVENGRQKKHPPFPELPPIDVRRLPGLWSAECGVGGRAVSAGDLQAAIQNMIDGGPRRAVLGIDFVRPTTRLPKLQIWQERVLAHYPEMADRALPPVGEPIEPPEDERTVRLHGIGGWGTRTLGGTLLATLADDSGRTGFGGLGSAGSPRGVPVTFSLTVGNGSACSALPPPEADVVLGVDPNAFRRGDLLRQVVVGGTVIAHVTDSPEALWAALSPADRRTVRERSIELHAIVTDADDARRVLRADEQRARSVALVGAMGAVVTWLGDDAARRAFVNGFADRLDAELAPLGGFVSETNRRWLEFGFNAVRRVDTSVEPAEVVPSSTPVIPGHLADPHSTSEFAHAGRFWERVGYLHRIGDDGLADPPAAFGAVPASTSSMRDLSEMRVSVPRWAADACTGCGECWMQCPEAALPPKVADVEGLLDAAARLGGVRVSGRARQFLPHLVREVGKDVRASSTVDLLGVLQRATDRVIERMQPDPDRRQEYEALRDGLGAGLGGLEVATTDRYFRDLESADAGSGGFLALAVDPQACTGCLLCVDACPEDALVPVPAQAADDDPLPRRWAAWEALPPTPRRFVRDGAERSSPEEWVPSLFLDEAIHHATRGGDGVCPGCGERTVLRLLLSAVGAEMQPHVAGFVQHLDGLIDNLDSRVKGILAEDASVEAARADPDGKVAIELTSEHRVTLDRVGVLLERLREIRRRYEADRATATAVNATSAASVRGSVYPYNPYPVPWFSQEGAAPDVGDGILAVQLERLGREFAVVRLAERELDDDLESMPTGDLRLDVRDFTEAEWNLCPPVVALGDDGIREAGPVLTAMQRGYRLNLVVIDRPGSTREPIAGIHPLARSALAVGRIFVVQGSQADAAHLVESVRRGVRWPGPSLFVLHAPCPSALGMDDDASFRLASLARVTRTTPHFTFDPAAGADPSEQLELGANPEPAAPWVMEAGDARTPADWLAASPRFADWFDAPQPSGDARAVASFLEMSTAERLESAASIPGDDGLVRPLRSRAIRLCEDARAGWLTLRRIAGLDVAPAARDRLRREFDAEIDRLRAAFDEDLKRDRLQQARVMARRMAEGLLRAGNGSQTIGDLLARVQAMPGLDPISAESAGLDTAAPAAAEATAVGPEPEPPAVAVAAEEAEPEGPDEAPIVLEAYIDTERCTACNECTNLNRKMFAYNEVKQAYITDVTAGTFKQLVLAAEKCPVAIIHPGAPVNPDEPDLEKWMKRAEPFN